MRKPLWVGCALVVCLLAMVAAEARADTLTFTNGDQLAGTLVRANSSGVVFSSAMAGNVKVPWDHIRELQTTTPFVVVSSDGHIYQGALLVENSSLVVSSPTMQPEFLSPRQVVMVVTPKLYVDEVTAHPKPWQSWQGQVVGGFSQVSATQNSVSYTAQVVLQRPVPKLAWMTQKSNTQFHFQGTYGKLSQPNTPTVRTSIFTAALEQDEAISSKLFLFGNAQLDHNDAQGLQLQQAYGGGIGWKLKNTAALQLDLKADLHWTHQQFLSAATQSFLASSLSETMREELNRVIWSQSLSVTPSITQGVAYQMAGMSAWALPVSRTLSLNFTVVDNYLNNPQPGFLKNSLQYSTGLQISLR
ncbi:MAG: DUF481 domain-containing protein, partial [Terriglobales bacterium]